ncbi:IclR family transcriptional regulator C-terminal domain-containing protein [Acidaminococcus fermentans]|uniref:IclR family transcriptional regulator n=1 Tax=Acidaminococcus fermentans TaxID=905 RepID=UPI002432235C|nr:IclR family transcriptional regulator C-terminal domain-containing protein [Acidaminococcus fermentans]
MEKQIKTIQSIQRAVSILNCFTDSSYSLTLAEISDAVGLNINTTRGIVNTLVINGLITHNTRENTYSLGLYFLTKTNIINGYIKNYVDIGKPLLDSLSEKYHTSASLQLVNNRKVYSIYCAYPSNAAYTIELSEFAYLPFNATSSGKLLALEQLHADSHCTFETEEFKKYTDNTITDIQLFVKELKKIEKSGYATECDEFALGASSMAVPVYDSNNELILTVSTTFFSAYFPSIKEALLADLNQIRKKLVEYLNDTNS